MEKDSNKINQSDNDPELLKRILEENARLREENERFRRMMGLASGSSAPEESGELKELFPAPEPLPRVNSMSSVQEKIHLFRSLFKGREDVFAIHWIDERTGKKGYSPAKAEPKRHLMRRHEARSV